MLPYRVTITNSTDDIFTILEQPRLGLNRDFIMRALEMATMDMIHSNQKCLFITIQRDKRTIMRGTTVYMPNSLILWAMFREGDEKHAYFRTFFNDVEE